MNTLTTIMRRQTGFLEDTGRAVMSPRAQVLAWHLGRVLLSPFPPQASAPAPANADANTCCVVRRVDQMGHCFLTLGPDAVSDNAVLLTGRSAVQAQLLGENWSKILGMPKNFAVQPVDTKIIKIGNVL